MKCLQLLWVALVAVCCSAAVADEPILLDFYADWCQPCKVFRPTLESLAAEGFDIRPVDLDKRADLAAYYRVSAVPCCIVVDADGMELERTVGIVSVAELRSRMVRHRHPVLGAPVRVARKAIPGGNSHWRYERPAKHRAAVVRISCADRGGQFWGSGAYIAVGSYRVVLTARHVVANNTRATVYDCNRQPTEALVMATDRQWDCALLQPVGPLAVEPVEIAEGDEAVITRGRLYDSCGYGPDGRLACNWGEFKTWAAPKGAKTSDWMILTGYARQGDSGGPVFNESGQLVGLIWGHDSNPPTVACVQPGRIHTFLQQQFANRPGCGPNGCTVSRGVDVDVSVGNPTRPQSHLPWRRQIEGAEKANASAVAGLGEKVDGLGQKVDGLAAAPPLVPPTTGQQVPDLVPVIRRIDAQDEKIQGLVDGLPKLVDQKLEPISGKLTQIDEATKLLQKGHAVLERGKEIITGKSSDEGKPEAKEDRQSILGGFFSAVDHPQRLWLILAVVALFVFWKRFGGIHGFVESRRGNLEADAEAGGIKGKIASDILRVHDSALGERLGRLEEGIGELRNKAVRTVQAASASESAPLSEDALGRLKEWVEARLAPAPGQEKSAEKPVNITVQQQPVKEV